MAETQTSTRSTRACTNVAMSDTPIPPAWVLEGSPRARTHAWGSSQDRSASHWTWDCTAGRFRWYHDQDETIVIVEGRALVGAHGENPAELVAGDAAYFPAGTWTSWHVPDYVRKHAVLRIPVPAGMAFLTRGLGLRRHRLR